MDIAGIMKVTLLDFPGRVACTVFTGGCNFRCPFCYNSELVVGAQRPLMSEDEFFAFLGKRRGLLDGVAISGGEPTLQSDLPSFIRRIRSEFSMQVKLDTNGTNPLMLESLIGEGLVDYVAMDVKSGPTGYPAAAGIDIDPGIWEALMRSRDLLLSGAVDYEFRTTVVGGIHTDDDFYEIADLIRGADSYYLQRFRPDERVLCGSRGLYPPSTEDLERYLAIVSPAVECASLRGID